MEFHAIQFQQQIIGEFDIGLVHLVNQQDRRGVGCKSLPQFSLNDVIADIVDPFVAQLAVAQAADRIIFIQALLCLGGGFHMPFDKGTVQGGCDFSRQLGFTRARLPLDQQGALQRDRCIHGNGKIFGGDIAGRAGKTH